MAAFELGRGWVRPFGESAVAALVALALLAGCGAGTVDAVARSELSGGGDLAGETVTVASALTTESRLLAELAAIALEDRGATVERVEAPHREAMRGLLASGDIDVYWDRARTAWATEVEGDPTAAASTSIIPDVALADRSLHGFRWLTPSGYAGGVGFVAASETATAQELGAISDLAEGSVSLCVDPSFVDDPSGLGRLEAAIGSLDASRLIVVDSGQIPAEVEAGTCVGQVDRTDPRLATSETLTLLDDGDVLGPETPVPVVRVAEVTERAELVEVLNRVAPTISLAVMQRLVGQVESDGLDASAVAEGFLVARAMIDPPAG